MVDPTPTSLAAAWWQLIRAAEKPGRSEQETTALIEGADAVLDRLAETPAATGAALAAKVLVWNHEGDRGETIIGMRLWACIVADAQRLAGPELVGVVPDPIATGPRGLLDEARGRGAVWAREHVLRPHGLLAAPLAVLPLADVAD